MTAHAVRRISWALGLLGLGCGLSVLGAAARAPGAAPDQTTPVAWDSTVRLPLALLRGQRAAPTPVTAQPADTPSATASPTASVTPTETPGLAGPDLVVSWMTISMEDVRCYYLQPLGVLLEIANVGRGDAGHFVVQVNAEQRAVPGGLAAGRSLHLWFTGRGQSPSGETSAVVDSTGVVVESREDNNERREWLPPATPPVYCAPATAGPDPPDLAVVGMSIGMEDTACWYSQPLGTMLVFENRGAGAAGPFVVSVNDEFRAYPAGLAAGARGSLWFAHYRSGETVAVLDTTNTALETDEENNRRAEPLPIPTPPPACPSPTPAEARLPLARAVTPTA